MARIPLYKAAETEMLRRIGTGEWPVGLRLPNEFGLADEFGVSQGTMRRALITLETMGYLKRKPGRGTIVSEPETIDSEASSAAKGFHRLQDKTGTAPEVVAFRAKAASRDAAGADLALFGAGRLSGLERTLKSGGSRFALDDVVVPELLAGALTEEAAVELPDLLADLGLDVARIDDTLTAEATSMGDSVALSVDRHSALLVLTRVARDGKGRPIARQTLRMVTDHAAYAVSLTA